MSEQKPLAVGDAVGAAKVVQVAAGDEHTAALLADGRVVCWGTNSDGQCNVPADLGPAVQVAAGWVHTAALLADGRVVCWGHNRAGQCNVPSDLGSAVQVEAGWVHTAALLADGRVVCWGTNGSGQCNVPADLGPAVQVAAGWFHTAALLADGRVVCWGHKGHGRCNVPADLGSAVQVAAGGGLTAALLADGRVVCWGDNREGQCNVPADLGPAVQVAAGERHTAALLADGRTRVWGHSCDGVPWEIGDEQVVDFLISSGHSLSKSYGDQLLARLPSGSVKHTAAGKRHTAALLSDGRVVCWGHNRQGQCNVPSDLGPAVQVEVAYEDTAALLADGRTRVWGKSCSGVTWEISDEQVVDFLISSGHSLTMEYVGRLLARLPSGSVKLPAAYGYVRSAALLADGRMWVWGESCDGVPWEIGDEQVVDFLISSGHSLSKSYGDQLLARLPSGSVKHTPAGHSKHTAALLADGRVVCWGRNREGQCNVPADLGPAVQVAAGGEHTAALLADGRVVCWGENKSGQCDIPADLGPPVQVAAGGYHTVALLADGRVVCWPPARKRVHDGLVFPAACNVPADLGPAVQVAAGVLHTAALLADGRVVCWGRSDEGQCNVPASIQGRAAAIHADASSTWAVDVDGRLHGWGEIKKVDSLPFELTDDSWLEFATRTWGQIKQKIYPEHIRKSAAFKAIRTMHKLAEQ